MSVLPMIQAMLNEDLGQLYDQNFGLGLMPEQILHPTRALLPTAFRHGYLRPWRTAIDPKMSGLSKVTDDNKQFSVALDVQQFKPEEIKVKVAEGFVVVEGQHEERSDEHGFISRQFTRRYKLPENVDQATINSNLSSDGVLTLHAPKKITEQDNIREIPIIQTNQPSISQQSSQ